jgi:hypothetical protein
MDTNKVPQKIHRYETSHQDKTIGTKLYGTKRPDLCMKHAAEILVWKQKMCSESMFCL